VPEFTKLIIDMGSIEENEPDQIKSEEYVLEFGPST
jgi:hypothetical protein